MSKAAFKKARKNAGLTIAEAAKKADVSLSTISRAEAGGRVSLLRDSIIKKLAEAYGVSPGYLRGTPARDLARDSAATPRRKLKAGRRATRSQWRVDEKHYARMGNPEQGGKKTWVPFNPDTPDPGTPVQTVGQAVLQQLTDAHRELELRAKYIVELETKIAEQARLLEMYRGASELASKALDTLHRNGRDQSQYAD